LEEGGENGLWQRNFRDFGKVETRAWSIRPVIEAEAGVRYAATTVLKAADWHSVMKSVRFVEAGVIRVARVEREAHSLWAL